MAYKGKKNKKDYKGKKRETRQEKNKRRFGNKRDVETALKALGLNFSMPNSVFTNTGGYTDAIEYGNSFIHVNIDNLLDSSVIASMVGQNVQDVMDSYAASKGYATNCTASDIFDIIRSSFKALSYLVALKRTQDLAQIKDHSNNVIHELFTKRNRISSTAVADIMNDAALAPYDDTASLTNYVWANTYVSSISGIYLNADLVNLIITLFAPVFTVDKLSSGSSTVMFVPYIGTAMHTAYTLEITTLQALVTSQPDYPVMLGLFNFSNEEVVALDFTRDLAGKTINIIQSPDIMTHMLNAQAFNMDTKQYYDTDVQNVYVDYQSPTSMVDIKSSLSMSISKHTLWLLFNNSVLAGSKSPTDWIVRLSPRANVSMTGTVSQSSLFNPGVAISVSSSIVASTNMINQLNRYTVATALYSLLIDFHNPWVSTMVLAFDVTTSSPGAFIVSSYVGEGFNTYIYSTDEAKVLRNTILASLYFGANFRPDLDKKITLKANPSSVKY